MSKASNSNEWATGAKLFAKLDERYRFNVDAAAAPWNAKCPVYWTKRDNALKRTWYGRVFLNPPYSRGNLARFMAKARAEVLSRRAELVGCLVPGHTAEAWYHDHVEAPHGELVCAEHHVDELGATTILDWSGGLMVSITRLRGRQKFRERSGKTGSARFPSIFVVFERVARLQTSARRRD
jgi:hypothetical protein